MRKINKTSMLLEVIWLITSLTLIFTQFEEWFEGTHPVVMLLVVVIPAYIIRLIFNRILRYDFFNKDHRKNEV